VANDRIEVRGLRVVGVHGALPEEQDRAQPFEVDVDVEADLSVAGASDHLPDTVDYATVAAVAAGVVTGERCRLLERLAERIASRVADVDPRIRAVTVTVRKLRPPVPVDLASAGVRITRLSAPSGELVTLPGAGATGSVTGSEGAGELVTLPGAGATGSVTGSEGAGELVTLPGAGATGSVTGSGGDGRRRAFLGLGSNLGDRLGTLRIAVAGLPDVVAVSPLYETEAVGGPEDQPPYLNLVVELSTDLSARQLLEVAQQMEAAAGRVRAERFGPRILDVDILLVGEETIDQPDLTVPHPRMARRRFVVAPLADLAPELVAPDWADSATGEVRVIGRLEGDERHPSDHPSGPEREETT